MFKERYKHIVIPSLFIFNLFVVYISYLVCELFFGYDTIFKAEKLFILLFWVGPSFFLKTYRVPRVSSYIKAIKPCIFNCLSFSIIYIFYIFLGFNSSYIISFHLVFLSIVSTFQLISCFLRYNFFYEYRLQGKNISQALLFGNLTSSEINRLNNDSLKYGYHFIETISKSENYLKKIKIITNERRIDFIFLYESNKFITDSIKAFCDDNGIRMKIILPMSSSTGMSTGLDIIGGFLIIDVRYEPLLYLENRFLKRLTDIIVSIISIILVLSWLPILVKAIQALTYPGPLFFIQERVGHEGKIFKLYKFRSMKVSSNHNLAKEGKSELTIESDTRVTSFGSLLRRTNLDEYPQFINVLLGKMSTVGPRPHMVGEDQALENLVPKYRVRRFVKPGLTGWAAINGLRGGTKDVELMVKRTKFDIWYLENWNIFLDIKIIFITIWQMITFKIPKAY
jgi:putative colanic acid biosysnthesis UDP-glucose lipid carrier transferase